MIGPGFATEVRGGVKLAIAFSAHVFWLKARLASMPDRTAA